MLIAVSVTFAILIAAAIALTVAFNRYLIVKWATLNNYRLTKIKLRWLEYLSVGNSEPRFDISIETDASVEKEGIAYAGFCSFRAENVCVEWREKDIINYSRY